MEVEEQYLDVLQNIEAAIVAVYREYPLLVDFDVENALSALIARFRALSSAARPPNLNERAMAVHRAVEGVCQWRLGEEPTEETALQVEGQRPEPVSQEAIVACLKRIRKSVQRWNKEGGRQGYLTFIARFVR